MNDPYQILGISSDATKAQIRRAYRRLAMKWHPDKNQGNPDADKQFKEIQQAYEDLINNKPPLNQDTGYQDSNTFYSALQDHPFQSLREMVIRYYEEKNWFKKKKLKNKNILNKS